MSRIRTSLVLLAMCVVAIVAAWVGMATQTPDLPAGSSYSREVDGAEALYLWALAEGAAPTRISQSRSAQDANAGVLLVVQPEELVSERDQRAFDAVARRGGTIVLAGGSFAARAYARELDVTLEPAQPHASAESTDGLVLTGAYNNRVRADDATPLLVASNGDWLALRKPHLRGSVIVIASAEPLTNLGLRDPDTARFVYREILQPAIGKGLAFDEVHHSYAPSESEGPTVNNLLFETSLGRAAVAAAVLVFGYLLLAGRRLGPPLPPRPQTSMRRTMFEHVQMLAGLYRRAGQLDVVRARLAHVYSRTLARGTFTSPHATHLSHAISDIERARSEPDLVAAVARADEAVSRT
jgi:hypothetical protein